MSGQQAPGNPGLGVGQALISGKALSQRSIATSQGRRWLTVVALPAPDEYSKPGVVELRSVEKLASAAGEMVRVKVAIGGYPRSYEVTSPDSGEKVRINSAQNSLDVVS